ncbi:unknown [[Mannheimia] succiniciproducens MBEL55E]|uniref:Uncharacterized protein n=1 Tax=Mannheimia succiniciproducens (strain KCTC 0769BP / MBEL55E) TaxID=221988 RepID=Q65U23_MANSM|nr:unknown [[Mannheimia] succiniciproducens MBEL55E]
MCSSSHKENKFVKIYISSGKFICQMAKVLLFISPFKIPEQNLEVLC